MQNQENKKKGRCLTSAKSYLIKIVLCIVVLSFLFLVYYKWVTIPVYKHYYNAEHLLSNNGDLPVQSSLAVYDNKGFSKYNNLPEDYGTGVKEFYSQFYGFSSPFGLNDSLRTQYLSEPIYKDKSIADILGPELYQKLCDYCTENKIDLDTYNRRGQLFYFCHMHNAKFFHKQKTGITRAGGSIYIQGTNDSFLSSLKGCEDYRKLPFDTGSCTRISKKLLRSNGYKTIQEGFVLKLDMDDWVTGGNNLKPLNLLPKTLMLEDITQAYYDITLQSKSIPDMNMKMEFNGAIDCKIHNDGSINKSWNTNISSFALTNRLKVTPNYSNGLIRVSFNDMENIQAWRLVVLGAFASIILSYLLQYLNGILKLFCKRGLICKKHKTK